MGGQVQTVDSKVDTITHLPKPNMHCDFSAVASHLTDFLS